MVAKYKQFERTNLLKQKSIIIGGNQYLYSALFKRIKDQYFDSYQTLSQRRRVYWGRVLNAEIQIDGDIRFSLSDEPHFKTAPAIVSVFIKKSVLDSYSYKRPIREVIIESVNLNPKDLYIYVYGIPSLDVKDKVHLNFRLSNLDLIEIQK